MSRHLQSRSRGRQTPCIIIEDDSSVSIRAAVSSSRDLKRCASRVLTNPKIRAVRLKIDRNGVMRTDLCPRSGQDEHARDRKNGNQQKSDAKHHRKKDRCVSEYETDRSPYQNEHIGATNERRNYFSPNQNDPGGTKRKERKHIGTNTDQYSTHNMNPPQSKNICSTHIHPYQNMNTVCGTEANERQCQSMNYSANEQDRHYYNPNKQLRRIPSCSRSYRDCPQTRKQNCEAPRNALFNQEFSDPSSCVRHLVRKFETDNFKNMKSKFNMEFEKLSRLSLDIKDDQGQPNTPGCQVLRKCPSSLRSQLKCLKSPKKINWNSSHCISKNPERQCNVFPSNPHHQSCLPKIRHDPLNPPCRPYSSNFQRTDPSFQSRSPHNQGGVCHHCSSNLMGLSEDIELNVHVGSKDLENLMKALSDDKIRPTTAQQGTTLLVDAKEVPKLLNILSGNKVNNQEESNKDGTQTFFVDPKKLPELLKNLIAKNQNVKEGVEDGGKVKTVHFAPGS